MLSKRSTKFLILTGMVVGLLMVAANPFEKESHCYSVLSPVDVDSNENSQIIESGCFDTFTEAIQAATGGRVHLNPNVYPDDVTEEMLNANVDSSKLTPESVTVIGIDYKNASFGGSSYAWSVTGSGCTDTLGFRVSSMPSGWDNAVSSARSYSDCNNYYHWENTNYAGAVLDCGPSCASMGVMNDQTSSEEWYK